MLRILAGLEMYICVAHNIYECTYARYELTTSVFTLCEQLRHHQFLVQSLTRNEFFAACVVRVPLHTQVFLKLEPSCSVHIAISIIIIIIITSNDDPKPSTVLSEQSPTELIAID